MSGTGATSTPAGWSRLLPCGVALLLAALLRAGLLGALDLSDLPGPGGAQFLALALQQAQHDLPLPALVFRQAIRTLPWLGPVGALRVFVLCSNLLGLSGAMLAAGALGGRRAALFAGLLLACWAPHQQQALLLGMDAPAMGLAWLGLGLALAGAPFGWRGLPLAGAGAALCLLGGALKPVALPVAALLPVLALQHGRDGRRALAFAATAALGGLLGWAALRGADIAGPGPGLAGGSEPWPARLAAVPALLGQGLPRGFLELVGLALAGGLVPGPGWVRRLALLVLGLAALALALAGLGDWLRPRFLVPASLGLWLPLALGLAAPRGRWGRRGATTGAGALLLLLSLDALAFFGAWSAAREAEVGTAPGALPAASAAWARRYAGFGYDESLSAPGARDLVRLAREAPPGGIAVTRLQDGREAHAEAGAALAGRPAVVLDPGRCCAPGQAEVSCALELLRALDASGTRLIAPAGDSAPARVPREAFALTSALGGLARARDGARPAGPWWTVLDGAGRGGPLPCGGMAPYTPSR